ncbi:MAG: hypothetical protein RL341_1507 [Pseudomonadota bacterium]|jgi:hypothetical protein
MRQVAVAALIGAVTGVAGAVAVMEIKYAPGSWFRISGDPYKPDMRVATQVASDGAHCLYKSERYKPGDVLEVKEAGVKLACTAGSQGAGGRWLQVVDATAGK